MGIEQLDNEQRAHDKEKRRENKEKLDFFESQKLKAETSNLLQKLASQIADEFGIDISEVKSLISSSTLGNLDDLKSGISNNETINLSDLSSAINNAKKEIEQLSKHQIDSLKNSLDRDNYYPDAHTYTISKKVLPKKIIEKAINPQNFGDQLIGAGVGIFDSSEAIILFIYGLGKGVLLTPYHLFLIISGKSYYEWKSKI